ncbi:MAG: DUF6600 domain-containing protein [Verrucomicrobiota bacterium]
MNARHLSTTAALIASLLFAASCSDKEADSKNQQAAEEAAENQRLKRELEQARQKIAQAEKAKNEQAITQSTYAGDTENQRLRQKLEALQNEAAATQAAVDAQAQERARYEAAAKAAAEAKAAQQAKDTAANQERAELARQKAELEEKLRLQQEIAQLKQQLEAQKQANARPTPPAIRTQQPISSATYPAVNRPAGTTGQPVQIQDVSYFFTPLQNHGQWLRSNKFGYLFTPTNARQAGWNPYQNGRWAQTDYGWTWVSNEPHGWATTHYGRWAKDPQYGWVWFPDVNWGPAWVSWRGSNQLAGWAPLPPQTAGQIQIGTDVEQRYRMDPSTYVFIARQHLTQQSYLNHYLRDPRQLSQYFQATQNITKIYSQNGRIHNHGLCQIQGIQPHEPTSHLTFQAPTNVNQYGYQANNGRLTFSQAPNYAAYEVGPPVNRGPDVVRDLLSPLLEKHLGSSVTRDPRTGRVIINLQKK